VELLLYFHALLARWTVISVVEQAVVEAPLDVVYEVFHCEVEVMLEPLLNSPEVDRFFHDVQVVGDAQFVGVYGLVENLGGAAPPELLNNALGHLVPGVLQIRILSYRW